MELCILTGIPNAIGSTGTLKGSAASDLIIILITYKESKDDISRNEIIILQILSIGKLATKTFSKNMIHNIPTEQHSILPHCIEDPVEVILIVLGMSFHPAPVLLLLLLHYESGLYLKNQSPLTC